jgi:diguanylate cyclase (GGDEF)-like protein/PAS domain S-box-containing protein
MDSQECRILIVDDNEMNRDMLARRLERKGYSVRVAENARCLRERIQNEAVDLLLLDVEMPEISGLDALQTLREFYSATELPIIMVTAKQQSEDIVKALSLGANDYVTKPIDFPVALARIRTQASHAKLEKALRVSEERYALAAQGANDGLWDWNLQDNFIYFSPRWKTMLGYQENEIGNHPEEWLDRIHVADRERVKQEIDAHRKGMTLHFECEIRIQHKDGSFRWVLSRGLAVRDASGNALRMAGSQTDITVGKLADPLTGLPNRLLFLDRLERLFEHQKKNRNYLFAVMFLDLDGFKMINDSLGHAVGDQLLIGVANRLENCLRASDTVARGEQHFTIARLGGDEFTILLDRIKEPGDAESVAKRLMKALTSSFNVDGKEIFTSASIGIALSNIGYDNSQDIMRDADTAMYRAKSRGNARYEVFDVHMRVSVMARLQLETDLRNGLNREEFCNYYQPIVSIDSGRIVGFEALLRWQHPIRGLVQPADFITVAEETGMIRELGWWSLREACRQTCTWNAGRSHSSLLTISVNLSVKQLLQPNLAIAIGNLLRESELAPSSLKLEITESAVMQDPAAATEVLLQIKALGIQLSIDDFGTGYSSLSYLHRLPLDTLKIDRSFTAEIEYEGDSMEIVRTILPMAKNLRLDVIAEGVENGEQLAILSKLQCEYAQGYYFSKPLTGIDAAALLKNNPKW